MGETSRSLYERAKEHQKDRNDLSDKSHQIKHWLTDHKDLTTPPAFRYKLIQSFQDPMSRQLAEAVRIDLRGPNVLNSKTEYNRCKVPRVKVDFEEWKTSKEQERSGQEENHHLEKELENSLQERDLKRKSEEKLKSRPKRLRLEPLVGWGDNSIKEGEDSEEVDDETFPEGRMGETTPESKMDETTKGNEMLRVKIQAGWMKQAEEKLEEQDPGRCVRGKEFKI